MPIKFLANKNTIIAGQTGAGKTQFILEIIRQKLVEPFPENVYYMYEIEQNFMKDWNETEKQEIKFIKGLDFDKIDVSKPSMLVIDDLILSTNDDTVKTFLVRSHHNKISLFYLSQDIFHNSPKYRLMSKNTHYFVIFYSQRSVRQVYTCAMQYYMGKEINRVLQAYKRSSKFKRGFIVLSFPPELPRETQVLTDFWELCPSFYL